MLKSTHGGHWTVWLRLVAAFSLMLAVGGTAMVVLTYTQRRDAAVDQAREFAESINQMTIAALTGMMISDVTKDRATYLNLIRNSRSIKDLQVFRYGSVIEEFGEGEKDEAKPTAQALEVMRSGKVYFNNNDEAETLEAIFPTLNSRNLLGNNCTECHGGPDNAVIGAVSMKVDLKGINADTRAFMWKMVLFGAALTLPMICGVYYLVRRYVNAPLGGEPEDATAVAERIARCDLAGTIAVDGSGDKSLMAAMSRMQGNLADIVTQMHDSAGRISVASREIAQGNDNLSQRTEQQASAIEETASSLEQLTGTVRNNAENAKQANQLAQGASEVALRGGEAVANVVQTMNDISESSRRIEHITGVIDAIAFQTTILALNAAVEAARAGELGRGFAVVATEVRSLAQKCAEAAKEIKGLIGESAAKVEAGTQQVDAAGKTMEEIVSAVKRVTGIIEEISIASQEQRVGIEQVNIAISQVDGAVMQNASMVEQASAAAESMKQEAAALYEIVSRFKIGESASPASVQREPAFSAVATQAAPAQSRLAAGRSLRSAGPALPHRGPGKR
ncbi:MAG TPA: methyl-accepting chemotaxis protein [Usitatibacteraceae bacterium]|nr:methyl-accepting chemotaxis protein [Usitatibacteraceae bacterium]